MKPSTTTSFTVRAGQLLARLRYRQLSLAMSGQFNKSAVFAARAKRIRRLMEKMAAEDGLPPRAKSASHPGTRHSYSDCLSVY